MLTALVIVADNVKSAFVEQSTFELHEICRLHTEEFVLSGSTKQLREEAGNRSRRNEDVRRLFDYC